MDLYKRNTGPGPGGIHIPITGSFVLDSGKAYIANHSISGDTVADTVDLGLLTGATATLDIFYCERQCVGSDINIISNIITSPPINFYLSTIPAVDTIPAGDSIQISASVVDDTGGIHPEYSSIVAWTLQPTETRSTITTPLGSSNMFHGIDAYKWYNIISRLDDPTNPGRILLDTLKVYVKPGPASHLVIEANPDSTISLNTDNRLGSLTFPGPVLKDSVYAVLRDLYGNFVSHATLAAWVSRDNAVVTAAAARTSLGEGEIARQSASITFTYVIASQAAMKDSVQVFLSNVTYSQIQIVVRGTVTIDTLKMLTDQDTTLSARGMRSDNFQWTDLPVMWGNSAGMTFDNAAPASAVSWRFRPSSAATGKIFIAFNTGGQQRFDTITAIFISGPPDHIALNPPRLAPKLSIAIPSSGAFVFPLPADIAHSKLFFTLYSLSGRAVFKTDVADAGKPVCVNSLIQPGIYLVSLRTADRQLVKSRFVIVK